MLLLGLGTVVGQVVTSGAIDLPVADRGDPVLWQSLPMSSLLILSVVVAAVPWRRSRSGR